MLNSKQHLTASIHGMLYSDQLVSQDLCMQTNLPEILVTEKSVYMYQLVIHVDSLIVDHLEERNVICLQQNNAM